MAVVEKYGSYVPSASGGYGMGLVRSTSFGRKRIAPSNNGMDFANDCDSTPSTSPKRHCFLDAFPCDKKSALEELPQEILVRILCGGEHDDLKRLFFVSKAIREAALIAKQSYFAYSTPRKTVGFRNANCIYHSDDVEVPNAPKQSRLPRHRLGTKQLADITVALFASGDDEL